MKISNNRQLYKGMCIPYVVTIRNNCIIIQKNNSILWVYMYIDWVDMYIDWVDKKFYK